MARRQIVTGLDVGSTKVAAVIAEVGRESGIDVIGIGTSPSRGLRRGVVVDIESTVKAISEAVEKAERMAGVRVRSAFVAIAGNHVASTNNRGVVAVSRDDKEITQEDVQRVIEAARVVHIPSDREILHVIPRGFVVDGYDGIKDPVGMLGLRLEVEAHIVTGAMTSVQNLVRSVYKAGIEVDDVVLAQIASAQAVLEPAEMELGVVLVDVGGGTTDIAIFQEGTLCFTSVLPIGGGHVTSDIAVGLRTPIHQAEQIKIEHGNALSRDASDDLMIEVPSVGGRESKSVSEKVLATIIEARVQEIFSMVAQEIRKSGCEGVIPGGVVVTGGTSLIRGLSQLAEQELDLPVRSGRPVGMTGLDDLASSPMLATGVGLIRYAAESKTYSKGLYDTGRPNVFINAFERLKSWLREFI